MKKYTEYLEAQRMPMTEDIIRSRMPEFIEQLDRNQNAAILIVEDLIDEVDYLRSLLAEAYWWIGRAAPRTQTSTKVYRTLMTEAARIREELK
jgi:hypothetical protein